MEFVNNQAKFLRMEDVMVEMVMGMEMERVTYAMYVRVMPAKTTMWGNAAAVLQKRILIMTKRQTATIYVNLMR